MPTLIALPRILRIGANALAELPAVLTDTGCRRPLIVTDAFLTSTGAVARVVELLAEAGIDCTVFDDVVPDPTTESLGPAIARLRASGCDGVIGFGGGSSLDTAKAVALLATTERPLRDFKAPAQTDEPLLPIVAIPTTAGSGSEATRFTVVTDSQSGEKMLCPGLAFLPIAAVVDYTLTMTMPARLTADTGIDALTHAVEAYVSAQANSFSDGLALAAIATIGRYLRRAYADGSDAEAREHMMLASTQAGIAFSNSSVALVHGMSRPLGAHFHISHGLSNAMLFPAVAEFSLGGATARYADCARAYGAADAADSDLAAAGKFVEELRRLNQDLAVPAPHELGIAPDDWTRLLSTMSEQALASGSPQNNPVVPSADQICAIYRAIY
ncbi:iron-containing alcohol dehydrogenase [Gordonia sp. PP30]|uniref:iron-containing alcohol dehydrogenase n=1 Tax=Gordonia sp. PP30 TaxID=2935861 RepID=UPI00200008DF|nr:iron-containing alcohol dehydrogenase [Gordonia sp. PP30]UQE76638.1 iron-containing alcohol dehydrogenase [Gordonia sp. PP30]